MKLTYYGHSCILAEAEGKRVIIDPFLSGNPNANVRPEEIRVDAVLLTHGHDDHLGDTIEIAKKNNCPVIATFELAGYCQRQGVQVQPMNTGGARDFDGFRVKWTQAFHSSSIQVGEQFLYAGPPAGILLTMGGKTLYHAGDTCLFGDMKWIGERNRIDAAALPIGDNYTMGPEDALTAAEWLKAKVVIPVHYNTFPLIRQDADAFARACEEKGIRCVPLRPGENLDL